MNAECGSVDHALCLMCSEGLLQCGVKLGVSALSFYELNSKRASKEGTTGKLLRQY